MAKEPQGIEKEIMEWANDPFSSANCDLTDEDRAFLNEHYQAIAGRLSAKRLWRGPWRVELANGCVYKFTVNGYAKKGTRIWREQEDERIQADRALAEMERNAAGLTGRAGDAGKVGSDENS